METLIDIKKYSLEINFDYNKWGVFVMGDGESFNAPLKNDYTDFYIFCEKKDECFYTTFIPDPINKKDTKSWDCKESIDLFSYAVTYKTTHNDIINNLFKEARENSMVNIEIPDNNILPVSNFDFYYMGVYGENIVEKTLPENHSLYKDLIQSLS